MIPPPSPPSGSRSSVHGRGQLQVQCLFPTILAIVLVISFPDFAGTHFSSSSSHLHRPPSQQQQQQQQQHSFIGDDVRIASNMSVHHSRNHHYYNFQSSGKRTMSMDYDDDAVSLPKRQWVVRPPRQRPVRHWWANLAHHTNHHREQHNKRSATSESTTTTTTTIKKMDFPDVHINNFDNFSSHGTSPLFECRDSQQWPGLQTPDVMSFQGSMAWIDRVCTSSTLDRRVKELLTALWLCPQHKVCQILSPEELRNLSDDHLCRQEASKLWHRFRNIFLVIRDFSDVFQEKFDTADYSVIFNSNQCQVKGSGRWLAISQHFA